jgi:hypothetical protein
MQHRHSILVLLLVAVGMGALVLGIVVAENKDGDIQVAARPADTSVVTELVQDAPEARAVLSWDQHTSFEGKISFDYPRGWQVTDVLFADNSLGNRTKLNSYNSIWVCPPSDALVATTQEGINNCIIFFTRARMLNPPLAFEDESPFFNIFRQYIYDSKSDAYDNLRILSLRTPVSQNSEIDLVGIYRNNDSLIGLRQTLCARDRGDECVIVFTHILDSIQFLP